ncbi:kinase [Salibacterium salarium]|uniref:Kinase n=1 Tax=Salibacterium salarium TaxID=284579 RepID=A0A428N5I6_9BACI|nr:sporulation phosphorelay system protein KapB [Salibacterium salarium]RSL33750.1 kinase [Salibacterium salarium]
MPENRFVKAAYKTGVYIGEPIQEKEDKTLIKIVAVLKHPMQGDLHNPKQVDVPLFHERKALAEFEKVWIPTANAKIYEEVVPDYRESLISAYNELKQQLEEKKDEYSQKSLETLKGLEHDYQLK